MGDNCYYVIRFNGTSDYYAHDFCKSKCLVGRVGFEFADRYGTRDRALLAYNLLFKEHDVGIYKVTSTIEKVL